MKEKLQEYALIAEIVSALAVVAGLIFVGLEINQSTDQNVLNTRAMEADGYQNLIGQIIEINNLAINNSELNEIVMKGNSGELTDPYELNRFSTWRINILRHADMACYQYQLGVLDEKRLAASMAIFMATVYPKLSEVIPGANLERGFPGLSDCISIVEPIFNLN